MLCLILCNPMECSMQGFPVLHYLPELAQTYIHRVCDAIQPPHPPSSLSPPGFNLSSIRVFSSESAVLSGGQSSGALDFSISPSNEFSELISFRINWFDLLAVQGTIKSLLQHHTSKASILWCSAFFIVSHPYMTTRKTKALTKWTFVGKVMSLCSSSSVSVGMSIKNTEVILGRLYYIGNLWFSSGVYSFCISVSVDSWNEISPHRYSIISGDFVLLTHKCNIVLTNHKQNLLTFLSFLILKWV